MRLPALFAMAATIRMPPSPALFAMAATVRMPQSPVMCAGQPNLPGLIDEALKLTVEASEAERQSLMENTVVSWLPSERQRLSDELSDLMTTRADTVQKAAVKLFENDEDYSAERKTLETLVDMTVQVKMLVRRLQAAAATGEEES